MSATPSTGRIQLALNVTDLDASVRFYTDLFGQGPGKEKEGYANFAIAEPPLKLILVASPEGGTINHLGVEVQGSDDVKATIDRLSNINMPLVVEENVTCCYATQDKAWATAPDGERWEYYAVRSDADAMEPLGSESPLEGDPACCGGANDVAEPTSCCAAAS